MALLLLPAWTRAEGVSAIDVEVLGEIDAPLATVRETLLDLEAFGRWFPATEDWRVLARTPDSAVVYGRLALPWPVDDRDYVARYSWTGPTEPFVLDARALEAAEPTASDDIVRVEDMHTTWHLEPLGTGTRVRYVYRGSPGGSLPDWVARIGWEMQTGILIDALADEVERRRAPTGAANAVARSTSRPPR